MKAHTWATALLASLAAAMLLSGPAWAQSRPAGPQGERPGGILLERVRNSLGDLKLSDEQKKQVDAIFAKSKEQLDALRTELQGLEPQQRMERAQEFARQIRDEVSKVLDEDQRKMLEQKFNQARQNIRERVGQRPSTSPAGGPRAPGEPGGPGGPGGPAAIFERLRENLPKLDLSEDQRARIKDLMDELRSQGQALRQQAQAGEQGAREKGRELMQRSREKLMEILSPEQRRKLESLMAAPAATKPAAMMMDGDGDSMTAQTDKGRTPPRSATPVKQAATATGAKVGDPAPQFTLKKLDGSPVQLSSLKGRVVVLIFGSWTCPAFRDRAPAIEDLKNDYSTSAQVFVVYQREAHAKGEWEVSRNRDNEIAVEQPGRIEQRNELAKAAREKLKLSVPIIVDTLGNDAQIAYGALANSAFVIDRNGTIVAKQDWCDPAGLRSAIDEAIKAAPATRPTL